MSLELVRLDDRLIHGQVVIGWVKALGATRIIVVNDRVAATPWEQEIYRLGVPASLAAEFTSVDEAIGNVERWLQDPDRIILLLSDVDSVIRLFEGAQRLRTLNLGGLHDGPERRQRVHYVYLTDHEADELRALAGRGVDICVRAVPTESEMTLTDVLT